MSRSCRVTRAAGRRPRAAAWLAAMLFAAPAAALETVHPELWVANNDVLAIARSGTTLYIGGNFDYVGPATGAFTAVDLASGVPTAPSARVALQHAAGDGVYAAVPDGGGWYIGGQFPFVGGVARSNLAHLLADGHAVRGG